MKSGFALKFSFKTVLVKPRLARPPLRSKQKAIGMKAAIMSLDLKIDP